MEPRLRHIKTEYLRALRDLIANWIPRNMDKSALVTITKCEETSDHGGSIAVFVSVLPEQKMTGAISFLRRHADEIAHEYRKNFPNRRIPFLHFEVDIVAPTRPEEPNKNN